MYIYKLSYKVIRAVPSTEEQVASLKKLEASGYDFWKDAGKPGTSADIMASPKKFDDLTSFLSENNIPASVIIDNVQRYMHHSPNKLCLTVLKISFIMPQFLQMFH